MIPIHIDCKSNQRHCNGAVILKLQYANHPKADFNCYSSTIIFPLIKSSSSSLSTSSFFPFFSFFFFFFFLFFFSFLFSFYFFFKRRDSSSDRIITDRASKRTRCKRGLCVYIPKKLNSLEFFVLCRRCRRYC